MYVRNNMACHYSLGLNILQACVLIVVYGKSVGMQIPAKKSEIPPEKLKPEATLTSITKDVDTLLRKARIIPDVIEKKPPQVLYASNYHFSWNFGQVFDISDVTEPPHHLWWISEDKTYYTLLLLSPDFPEEKYHSLAQYQHWIVVNIPGIWVEDGDTLTEYLGSEPYSIGKHRMVLLLFKQPAKEKMTFLDEPIYTKKDIYKRGNFSALQFAKKYGMGDPLAINFVVLDMEVLPHPSY